MNLHLFRLRFRGPVRFGREGVGLEETEVTLASDALTSAFVNALAELEGKDAAGDFITKSLEGHPPAVFSSLFPFGPSPEGPCTEVVPKPLSAPPDVPPEKRKTVKKARWLRPADAARWLSGKPVDPDAIEKTDATAKNWWCEEMRPRVALDRDTSASVYWMCSAVQFDKGAGLYGLVRVAPEFQGRFAAAMRLLGDMGIGGERTYGFGGFEFEGLEPPGEAWRPLLEAPAGRHLLLSVFHPGEAERAGLAEALDAWKIIERRGYITTGRAATTLKRRRVRFLAEGSVFRAPLRGTLADVTPENHESLGLRHRVYRSGLALALPAGEGGGA